MPDPSTRPLVLIACADEEAYRICRDWFWKDGFEVVGTAAGDWALAIANEHRPDVIVTALALARLDGLSVIRHLRAATATEGIPILVMTQNADASLLAAARVSGGELLPMQATSEAFAAHVRPWLARRVSSFRTHRERFSTVRLMPIAEAVYAAASKQPRTE